MMSTFTKDRVARLVFILPGVVLLALFFLPLLALVVRAWQAGAMTHALSASALQALQLSLLTSTLATVLAVGLGTPLAYALARWRFRFKTWVAVLTDLPLVLPPSVAGLLLLLTFGRRGLFGPALQAVGLSVPFTLGAVVLAQLFVAAPLYVRAARIGFAGVDPHLEEAASVEGASPWQVFHLVMLPLASRALLGGMVLTWTRALGEFGATMLFAGNLPGVTQTMPVAIYLGFERDLGTALVLSGVLVVASLVVLVFLRQLEKRDSDMRG